MHQAVQQPKSAIILFGATEMRFGDTIRELRSANGLTLRALGGKVGVSHAYISKIENGKLDYGDYPSEGLIRKLAVVLEVDVDELLLLAEKIPDPIRKRVMERPDAFQEIARLDDRKLDRVLAFIKGV